MPTYEYRCRDCNRDLEIVQSFQDPALTECPSCGGTLRKRFGSVGITFKGSGFYRTDSRVGGDSEGGGGDKSEKADKAEKSKSTGGEAKPAGGDSSSPSSDTGSGGGAGGGAGSGNGSGDAKPAAPAASPASSSSSSD